MIKKFNIDFDSINSFYDFINNYDYLPKSEKVLDIVDSIDVTKITIKVKNKITGKLLKHYTNKSNCDLKEVYDKRQYNLSIDKEWANSGYSDHISNVKGQKKGTNIEVLKDNWKWRKDISDRSLDKSNILVLISLWETNCNIRNDLIKDSKKYYKSNIKYDITMEIGICYKEKNDKSSESKETQFNPVFETQQLYEAHLKQYSEMAKSLPFDHTDIEATKNMLTSIITIHNNERIEIKYVAKVNNEFIPIIHMILEIVFICGRKQIYTEIRNSFNSVAQLGDLPSCFLVDTLAKSWIEDYENIFEDVFTTFKEHSNKISDNVQAFVSFVPNADNVKVKGEK